MATAQATSIASFGNQSSTNIIGQISNILFQPRPFFYKLPHTRHWLIIAIIVLGVVGYDIVNQASMPEAAETSSIMMTALLAATGMIATWFCQALLLTIITLAQGYAPTLGRNFQIAIWASTPLALMIILRQLYFSSGGTGGELGLVMLLDYWDAYATLDQRIQDFIAILASNLTIFWIWNIALLYIGARYSLGGSRWLITLVLILWITLSTGATSLVSEPTTSIVPIVQTQASEETNNETDTTTQAEIVQPTTFDGNFGGGNFGGANGGGPGGRGN